MTTPNDTSVEPGGAPRSTSAPVVGGFTTAPGRAGQPRSLDEQLETAYLSGLADGRKAERNQRRPGWWANCDECGFAFEVYAVDASSVPDPDVADEDICCPGCHKAIRGWSAS